MHYHNIPDDALKAVEEALKEAAKADAEVKKPEPTPVSDDEVNQIASEVKRLEDPYNQK